MHSVTYLQDAVVELPGGVHEAGIVLDGLQGDDGFGGGHRFNSSLVRRRAVLCVAVQWFRCCVALTVGARCYLLVFVVGDDESNKGTKLEFSGDELNIVLKLFLLNEPLTIFNSVSSLYQGVCINK